MAKVSGIKCPRCKEELWSKYTHDFHYCGCGYCFIDGGRHYTRFGWGAKYNPDGPQDLIHLAEMETEYLGKPLMIEIEVPEEELTKYDVRTERWPY